MKTLQFNTNSWHFWLATKVANFKTWDGTSLNICTYLRSVFAGGVIVTFFSTVALVASFVVLSAIWYWCGVLFGLIHHKPNFAQVFGTVLSFVGLITYGLYRIVTYLYNREKVKDPNAQPGFIVSAYRSWKDKTCVRVSFSVK